jgi:hypothetical protein
MARLVSAPRSRLVAALLFAGGLGGLGAPTALIAAPGPAAPGPFTGQLGEGEHKDFDLPTAARQYWYLSLAGAEGSDLDLRVACGERRWASRGESAFEELLVPADRGMKATIEHFGGQPSQFELTVTPVLPGKKLALGKPVDGQANSEEARFQVHELPPTDDFTKLALASSGGKGTDLDLYVYDKDWKLLQSSTGDEADETCILSPSPKKRFAVVKAWQGTGAYTLGLDAVAADARRLGDTPLLGKVAAGGAQWFRLRTTQPGVVTIHLDGPANDDLDLAVYGPDGYSRKSVASDANEEIAINGARRGDYLIGVYPGDEKSSGEFTITKEDLALSRLAANGNGGSKVWGLFVGIAAYEEVNNLTYTPKDALSVYQTMRSLGQVDSRHSIVLLDEAAKRADIVRALETIAARADEDDTFVFFFSGHGGNDAKDGTHNDRKDEADGVDEYLVCQDSNGSNQDGDLIDDDLQKLLDAIPCKKQLLLFDACFCGGFAEVVDRDGRYALLSSLETQTSNEAAGLKAGLMTALINKGLEGEADEDKDGKVTVGELSAYIERVQPNTCPGCQATLTPQMHTCPECGEALSGDNARQIPVIASKLDAGFVLTDPGKRQRAGASPRPAAAHH